MQHPIAPGHQRGDQRRGRIHSPKTATRQKAAPAIDESPVGPGTNSTVIVGQELGIGTAVPIVVQGDDVGNAALGREIDECGRQSHQMLHVNDVRLFTIQYGSKGGLVSPGSKGAQEDGRPRSAAGAQPVYSHALLDGGRRFAFGCRLRANDRHLVTGRRLISRQGLGVEFRPAYVVRRILMGDMQYAHKYRMWSATGRQRFIACHHPLHHIFPLELVGKLFSGLCGESFRKHLVAKHALRGQGKPVDIGESDQQTVDAVVDYAGYAAGSRGDDRHTMRPRFKYDDPE